MAAGDTHPVDSLLNLARGSDIYIEQCMGPIKDFAALPNNSQYLLNVSICLAVLTEDLNTQNQHVLYSAWCTNLLHHTHTHKHVCWHALHLKLPSLCSQLHSQCTLNAGTPQRQHVVSGHYRWRSLLLSLSRAASANMCGRQLCKTGLRLACKYVVMALQTSHVTPEQAGHMFNFAQPKLGVLHHLLVNDASRSAIVTAVIENYDGPIIINEDLMVFDVTTDEVVIRKRVVPTRSWGYWHAELNADVGMGAAYGLHVA